jgi:hypothetical protein
MFKGCHGIRAIPTFRTSMIMTNKGLQITLPVMGSSSSTISGVLNCYLDHKSNSPSSFRPSHIALPLRLSYKGDGTFDRRPRIGQMLVLEKEAAKAKFQTLTLVKRDATMSKGRNIPFVVMDEDRLGVLLENTIFTMKTPVIPDLDAYYLSWKLPLRTISFPTDLADYAAAFKFSCTNEHFGNATFCVLIESRRAQQLWSTHVFFFDGDNDIPLESVLDQKIGSFQNEGRSIAYDTELKKREAIGLRVRVDVRMGEVNEMRVTVTSTSKFLHRTSDDAESTSSIRNVVNRLRLRSIS